MNQITVAITDPALASFSSVVPIVINDASDDIIDFLVGRKLGLIDGVVSAGTYGLPDSRWVPVRATGHTFSPTRTWADLGVLLDAAIYVRYQSDEGKRKACINFLHYHYGPQLNIPEILTTKPTEWMTRLPVPASVQEIMSDAIKPVPVVVDAPAKKKCFHKGSTNSCPLHNLHCAYPKCEQ